MSLKGYHQIFSGSTMHVTTGTSEILWRDPEAEYKPRAALELARQDNSLQICPKSE